MLYLWQEDACHRALLPVLWPTSAGTVGTVPGVVAMDLGYTSVAGTFPVSGRDSSPNRTASVCLSNDHASSTFSDGYRHPHCPTWTNHIAVDSYTGVSCGYRNSSLVYLDTDCATFGTCSCDPHVA